MMWVKTDVTQHVIGKLDEKKEPGIPLRPCTKPPQVKALPRTVASGCGSVPIALSEGVVRTIDGNVRSCCVQPLIHTARDHLLE